jgi:hypothetical protein
MSLSTAKEEYIATTSVLAQVLWMKNTLKDIIGSYDERISILCDNTSAINISKNSVIHSRKKPISIRYHFLREKIAENEAKLEYVPIKDQVAKIFLKGSSKRYI